MFKEISFGNETKNEKRETKDESKLIKYLNDKNAEYTTDGDIIIVSRLSSFDSPVAIATHDDPDFWIADGDNWFAAGKQKDSPIDKLRAAAKAANAMPTLYLATTNIMDIDNKITEWESLGVRVIKSLDEL